jgi:hypothetical protein
MTATRFALGSLLFVALVSSTSMAQVQRTFVSGLGSDSNPCSRTPSGQSGPTRRGSASPYGLIVCRWPCLLVSFKRVLAPACPSET